MAEEQSIETVVDEETVPAEVVAVEAEVTPAEEAVAETVDAPETAEAVEAEAAPAEEAEEAAEAAPGEEAEEAEEEEEEAAPTNPNLHWYVVHTYSGYENRAKASLEERIVQQGLAEQFGQVLIPTENVVEMSKGGQKRTTKRKFFPGYMLVQMELSDQSWHLVKGTTRITGFVGGTRNPPRVPANEVQRLTKQIDEGTLKPKPLIHFVEGENVRVIDGPFANFNGVVESVNPDKGKVRVMVSIFGRSTPVELEFIQVEKA